MSNKRQSYQKFEALMQERLAEVSIDENSETKSLIVSAPLSLNEWSVVEPTVAKCLKESGLAQFYTIDGCGTGFGLRDVFLYPKA